MQPVRARKHPLFPVLPALLLALCLLLSGCGAKDAPSGKKAGTAADIYAAMAAKGVLPAMLPLEGEELFDLVGLDPADCAEITYMIAENGLAADEIALLTAVDSAAADRCEAVLRSRVEARSAEFEGYLPEQYAVMKNAVLLRDGLRLALIVSPEAQALKAVYGEYR